MAPAELPGEDDPFESWPLFGDLTRMLGSASVSRQAAEQLAVAVASDNRAEANVTPADRIAFDELASLAQLATEAATGLPVTPDRRPVDVTVVNRSAWARHTLRDWQPLFAQLRETLARDPADDPDAADPDDLETHRGGPEEMLRRLMAPLAPLLADMTAGSFTGRLARVALGSYDVVLPRVRSDRVLLVAPNIASFAKEWSLPRDDTCLWVCVHSFVVSAVLGVPHVHRRLSDLLERYAGGFEMHPEGLAESLQSELADLDPAEAMNKVPKLLGNPELMLGAVRSGDHEALDAELAEVTAVLAGYVNAMTERVCGQMLGAHNPVREAFRRRRLTPLAETLQLGRLLGTGMPPAAAERGARFVAGVTERAGPEGLGRLWQAAENWPTPSEIDAAGLWLARLELYEGPEAGEP